MYFTDIPVKKRKTQRQITQFLGLNRAENTREGEMRYTRGLSTDAFPYLTQRKARGIQNQYTDVDDLYEWDGKLVVISGGQLYYDGAPLCNVTSGKKQFAVVNTKLVVWPDAILVDLKESIAYNMKDALKNSGTATLDVRSMTFPASSQYATIDAGYIPDGSSKPWIWTYSAVAWSEEDGWTLTDPQITHLTSGSYGSNGRYYIPEIEYSERTKKYVADTPVIIQWSSTRPTGTAPAPANDLGFYGKITADGSRRDGEDYIYDWLFDIFRAQMIATALNERFFSGDVVKISNTPYGFFNADEATIDTVTEDTITFREDILKTAGVPAAVANVSTEREAGNYSLYYSSEEHKFKATENIPAGSVLYQVSGETSVHVWDKNEGKDIAVYKKVSTSSYRSISASVVSLPMSTTQQFSVSLKMPELDYICERGNRLWGVSNKDKTIYCSALGLPQQFYSFGNDAGAYAVAVGSEGNFTGICSYNGVCCWKENRLHKVMGDYPSEYYVAEQQISGVQEGSNRSMLVINEVLYFKGVFGIFAYSGSGQSLISYALGKEVYTEAAAGTDGSKYYISMKDGNGLPGMYVYDLQHGLWMREDDLHADAFATADGAMYFLSGKQIYRANAPVSEAVEWIAEFVPFEEDMFRKQFYTKLLLRLEMEPKTRALIEIREDNGTWEKAWEQKATERLSVRLPIRVGRCDRLTVRISGYGNVTLMGMAREYQEER